MNKTTSLALIIMILAVLLGIFHAKSAGVNLFEEQVFELSIKSESDIAAMGKSFHNNICTLESDITVENLTELASREFPFVGVFDGQGYTVTFKGEVSKSLFGYIGKGGVVKNLNIEVSSCELAARIGAILALENEGTIINCRVSVDNATVHSTGAYAAIVTHNKGVIKNVYARASFGNSVDESASTSKHPVIGGIAAYNQGQILSSISEISYNGFTEAEKENIFNNSALNTSLGAVYGASLSGVTENCAAIIDTTDYVSDCKNSNIFFATADERRNVFSEEMLFTTLGFNSDRWAYQNSMFTLIEGEDNGFNK